MQLESSEVVEDGTWLAVGPTLVLDPGTTLVALPAAKDSTWLAVVPFFSGDTMIWWPCSDHGPSGVGAVWT